MEVIIKKEYAINSPEWSCRDKGERRYPNAEWSQGFFAQALSIENPFLQKLIDMKGVITCWMGEWTLLAKNTYVMFHVYDDFINLECISTVAEERGKGSGTGVMKAIIEAAKETNTEIRLRACNVTGNGWNMPQHLVIAEGMKKKGKIPVAKLPKWYEKFGFVKVADVIYRGKKQGVNMVFNPKKKD